MSYSIREMRKEEYSLLSDFLYEAIYIPDGTAAPPKSVITCPELQVYIADFGNSKHDKALIVEVDGNIVGAIWARIMNDYGHIDENTPSLAMSVLKAYRGMGIGTLLLTQMLLAEKAAGYGLPVTISRCSNNYGPYQYPEKLIPLMVTNALSDRPLPVYGQGINVRDWIHVDDHCRAIDAILTQGKVGEIYNVGGHCERTNIDIVRMICRELGKPESLIAFVTDRKGHDMRYAIDSTKIEQTLGWRPEVNFDDGIRRTIRWYADRLRGM